MQWNILVGIQDNIRIYLRQKLLKVMVEEIASKGEIEGGVVDFSKRIGFNQSQISGTGNFAKGKAIAEKRIFDNTLQLVTKLNNAVQIAMQNEQNPRRKLYLEEYDVAKIGAQMSHKDRQSQEFSAIIQRQKNEMIEWGKTFVSVKGEIPNSRFLKKTFGYGKFEADSVFWTTTSAYQQELMKIMESEGFMFEKMEQIFKVTKYPDGFVMKRDCVRVGEIVRLTSSP